MSNLIPQGANLANLAEQINAEHAQAEGAGRSAVEATRSSLQHALNVGRLLAAARPHVDAGWEQWVEGNLTFSIRTAQIYSRLWREREQIEAKLEAQHAAPLSIRQAVALVSYRPEREEDDAPSSRPAPSTARDTSHGASASHGSVGTNGTNGTPAGRRGGRRGRVRPPAAPGGPEVLDALGQPVPPRLQDIFASTVLDDLAAGMDCARRDLRSVHPWNPHIDLEDLDDLLKQAEERLKKALPYCLCPDCDGTPPRAGCPLCMASGFLTEHMHVNLTAEEPGRRG